MRGKLVNEEVPPLSCMREYMGNEPQPPTLPGSPVSDTSFLNCPFDTLPPTDEVSTRNGGNIILPISEVPLPPSPVNTSEAKDNNLTASKYTVNMMKNEKHTIN